MAHLLPVLTPALLALRDNNGRTPVHTAAFRGHLDQLLPALTPAMLKARDGRGYSVIDTARHFGSLDQLGALLPQTAPNRP